MMHATIGGWVGQTFALATCNDSEGKKARIRRSKEERKAMVESFIKKYQNSNSGKFPSLNLTHKEVGGSFYTVREIVREIIQENRVLGPAKFSSEEQSDENILEHYPLGCISIAPQRSLTPLDETSTISRTLSKQSHGSDEELVENSNGQSFGSEHQRLHIEEVVNVVIETVKDRIGSDKECITEAGTYPPEGTTDEHLPNLSGQFQGPDCEKFDNELIGHGGQVTDDENEESNEPILSSSMSILHQEIAQEQRQENIEKQVLHSNGDFSEHRHLKLVSEEVNMIAQAVEDNNEYGLPVSGEDSPDVEKGGSKQFDASDAGRSCVKPDIVLEKFPLHQVGKKFDGLEGKSEEESQETRTLKLNGIEQDRVQVLENNSSFMNVEVGADFAGSSPKKKSEPVGMMASLNVGNPSLEMSNCSTIKEALALDIKDVTETKPVNAPISDHLNNVKTCVEDSSSSKRGSNSPLDRINLEAWEKTSEKPAGSETNSLLAFFKAIVIAFLKFWTE
ncbi:hypothetical protein ACH5RR_018947 [Cinchona calisaya]|uniref:AT3G52170-like helix-turn-helix domain-containing protein n=1 Tax=Cinchona calisaya TaxID=153742 RepID=A0ABD2ZNF6_9GENT